MGGKVKRLRNGRRGEGEQRGRQETERQLALWGPVDGWLLVSIGLTG